MSLKTFHLFFIALSIALCIGFGFWCLNEWLVLQHKWLYLVTAIGSFLSSLGLIFYFQSVWQKLKHVSFM